MTEQTPSPEIEYGPVGRRLVALAYALAIAGGLLMSGLVVMVVISIAGRALFSKPIYGDFEMVAMGTAVVIFLFLPHCHLQRGNVIVDLFLARAPEKVRAVCDAAGSLLLAVISGLLTWRMVLGAADLIEYHEVTMILGIPVWWAFPFIILSLALLTLSCLYTMVRDLDKLRP